MAGWLVSPQVVMWSWCSIRLHAYTTCTFLARACLGHWRVGFLSLAVSAGHVMHDSAPNNTDAGVADTVHTLHVSSFFDWSII